MSVTQLEFTAVRQFAEDVLLGLSDPVQKTIPAQYFYDAVGSALFEAITVLPEYGLTRADARLLQRHAREIVSAVGGSLRVAELGSGSGLKTRWILEEAARRQSSVAYAPIDVSQSALELCGNTLGAIEGIEVTPIHNTYVEGLREAVAQRVTGERLLILFLGSTIGNFAREEAAEFLVEVRALLDVGDMLLLGADLVKPARQLIDAYDDPAGVTAAFNLNLLARLNRDLGAEFNLRDFRHVALWNREHSRVEMHLESIRQQSVWIAALDERFTFTQGETIWTESSYKFDSRGLRDLARSAGFECSGQWIDDEWPFAESLFAAA